MADIKSVHKLLQDIPRDDPLKALQELTSWIESVTQEPSLRADYQYFVLRLLNDTARPFERKLTREYFSVAAPQKLQENRLWSALSEFYQFGSNACINVLRRYRDGDKGVAAIKSELPMVAARGIVAVIGRLKYAAVRYVVPDQETWEQLAEFYSLAESHGFLDETIAMYAGAQGSSTIRSEFAASLMWYATCAGTLVRLDIHLAQRLSIYLRNCFTVSVENSASGLYSFDLLDPGPPLRLSAPVAPRPGLLFIGVGDVQEHIERIAKVLDKGFVPEEINLGGDGYDAELVSNILHRLETCWSLPPQSRSNVRRRLKIEMRVVKGVDNLMEMVRANRNLFDGPPANWETDDISNGGFHAILSPRLAEGLEIGTIIGVMPQNVDYWQVGIVRRIGRDRQSNYQVGVELFASRTYFVGLLELHSAIGEEEQPALWIDGPSEEEVNLLMPPQVFSSGHSLRVSLLDRAFLLIPVELLGMGQDYDLARYRKVEQVT